MLLPRPDGRAAADVRPITITRNYNKYAEGSVLVEVGETRVICTASLEEKVPPFLRGSGSGWLTAEYGMLPRATQSRNVREAAKGKLGGRTQEIQRLIGRAIRSVVDMTALGERTLWIDCDVIQADGGTRTTAITGAFVAVVDALDRLAKRERWDRLPIMDFLAAVSVGIVDGTPVLDLNFQEDSKAQVDMNVVMTAGGQIVEVQGTAEGHPFSRPQLDDLLSLAEMGIAQLIAAQRQVLPRDMALRLGGIKAGRVGARYNE